MKSKFSRLILTAGILVSLSLGATAAVAVQGASSNPNSSRPAPTYPRNQVGLTYGSVSEAISRETEPDLISAVGDDGTKGFIYAKDLRVQQDFSNPAEAIAWQKANAGKKRTIDLFASDGKQKVGVFTWSAPTDEQIHSSSVPRK